MKHYRNMDGLCKMFEYQSVVNVALTLGVLLVLWLFNTLMGAFIQRFQKVKQKSIARSDRLRKITKLILFFFASVTVIMIWGIDPNEVWVLVAATAGFLGVALFAAWSLLSNIMGAYILFFANVICIGDRIRYLDGALDLEGVVKDMTLFFVCVEQEENAIMYIPNNVFLQRVVIKTKKRIKNGNEVKV